MAKEKTVNVKPSEPVTKANRPLHVDEYNLILASDITHSEALESIHKLPEVYQEKVIIEPLDDTTRVKLTLDVRLPESKAKNLRAALKRNFPSITMTPCE